MSFTDLLVPTYTQMLKALSGWLHKAEAQDRQAGADAILSARLAPDMFPLSTQVRFTCVQAYEAAHRLRGLDFPPIVGELLEEGRKAGEQPGSLAGAQARIAETVAFLEALEPGVLDVAADSPIAHELGNGMIFDLTAQEYVRDWALGQFYFHLMAAYAILRSQNVDVGKADYIPHLISRLRPGSGPTS